MDYSPLLPVGRGAEVFAPDEFTRLPYIPAVCPRWSILIYVIAATPGDHDEPSPSPGEENESVGSAAKPGNASIGASTTRPSPYPRRY